MDRGLFITGTGTDVGKTVVTAGILRHMRNQGIDAISMKPVQTGAEPCGGGFRAPDLTFHHQTARLAPSEEELERMAPYLYEPACSPHLAGRLAGRYPEIHHIKTCAQRLLEDHEFLLIEGAGGIIVPLDEETTMLDLMAALALPVILVAHRGLGTINHTLLSVEALRNRDLHVLGVVFNETHNTEEDYIKKDNPKAVKTFGHVHILGNIDYMETFDDAAWDRFEAAMPRLPLILDRARTP